MANSYDIGDMLADRGIHVRVGHHCCQPMLEYLKVKTLIRASFGIHTTKEEIDTFASALKQILKELST